MMTTNTEIKFTARARCFRGNGVGGELDDHKFLVDRANGTVRVYDSIAGYYTTLHGMTTRQESRIRNIAKGL